MLFCAAICVSCAEDALIDYDHVKPRIVIQSQLSPDSSFSIYVGSSLTATDPGEYQIPEGVTVSLVDVTDPLRGEVINVYPENDRFVAPQKLPKVGHSYKIFVGAPGYTIAEAITRIPEPVHLDVQSSSIRDLKVRTSDASPDKKNVSYKLNVVFAPHEHRYFHFNFFQTTTINHGSVSQPDLREYVYTVNPQFPDEDGYYLHHETGVLVDVVATNGGHRLEFEFVDYTLAEIEELGDLFIEVRSVSEEYYQYFTSLSRQLISRDDPFAEPIAVYNNVHEGFGNFSGFSRMLYHVAVIP